MALIQQIHQILEAAFPNSAIELHSTSHGHIGGCLIWEKFKGQPQIDRQVSLRDVLNEKLPPAQRLKVSLIMTLTPDEAAVLSTE